MRIGLIGKSFSLRMGGAERYGLDLARYLQRLGERVELVGQKIEDAEAGLSQHRLEVGRGLKMTQPRRFAQALGEFLNREKFDVTYGLVSCYPLDVLFLGGGVHAHHMRLRFPHPLVRAWRYVSHPVNYMHLRQERRMYGVRPPGQVIANSHWGERCLLECYAYPQERITVVRHGVDHDLFNPQTRLRLREERRAALHLEAEDLALVFVANNWALKGLKTILEAMALLRREHAARRVKVLVVGKGKQAKYAWQARQMGIGNEVLFVGSTTRVEEFYAAADVFVLPTQADPFAVVTLEAMAMGLPAITTTSNGAGELIRPGEDGFVLEQAEDARGLAERLKVLMEEGVRQRMGQSAHQRAQPYTHEANARETLAVLRQMARSG